VFAHIPSAREPIDPRSSARALVDTHATLPARGDAVKRHEWQCDIVKCGALWKRLCTSPVSRRAGNIRPHVGDNLPGSADRMLTQVGKIDRANTDSLLDIYLNNSQSIIDNTSAFKNQQCHFSLNSDQDCLSQQLTLVDGS
jgi:hypothetical protein